MSQPIYPKWRACVVLFSLGVVILSFGILDWIRDCNTQHWPTASGIIRHSGIHLKELMNSSRYYATIPYDYQVDGVWYSSTRVSFGDFWNMGNGSMKATRILSCYPEGKKVTVFYDPADPKVAVLETGLTERTWTAIISGVGFLLWGTLPMIWFFVRTM